MTETILIAGAGHAAGQTIVSLRQRGFAGKLMLVGVDPNVKEQMERTGVLHQIGHENVFLVQEGVGQALQDAVDDAEKWIGTKVQAA